MWEGEMTIRILIVLVTAVSLGCTFNPSLDRVTAREDGAVVGINVAQFDEAPARRTVPAPDAPPGGPGIGPYDFSVEEVRFRESAFLSNGNEAPSVKLIARNRGYAPVSVTVTYDCDLSENMASEVNKRHTSVVPPRSETVLARFDPPNNRTKWKLYWNSTWALGDYTARHECRERYRVPFPDSVQAHAGVPANRESSPYARNAVVFSTAAEAKVLAARKGTVVRISDNNDVDILHNDSTIATYSHLGAVAPGIREGRVVEDGEPVGSAAKSGDGAYMQLAVWRPEQQATTALGANSKYVFEQVSFPLEFRADSRGSEGVTKNRPVPSAPAAPTSGKASIAKAKTGEYDFSLTDVLSAESSYMPDTPRTARIMAVNRGYAPVSVTLDFDRASTENVKPDISLPHTAVILPQTETVLVRLSPVDPVKGMKLNYRYVWQLGDYATRHECPEHYRFPFANNVRAYAYVPDPKASDQLTRYSVQFSLPSRSKVLAVRNGVVVRVKKNNDIDILHGDSTIATYSHLGRVEKAVLAGKRVSAGDMLGVAGISEKPGEAYMQITVWRPDPSSNATLFKKDAGPNFRMTSFPLEFCSDAHDCRILRYNQPISFKSAGKKEAR
jgi:murein DD-endopeptidase MepM/ murein hydrolase activator NlpD